MTWQPIETAPRDGTLVIVYGRWAGTVGGNGNDGVRPMIVRWEQNPQASSAFGRNGFWTVFDADYYDAYCLDPTHWMPLPEAPDELAAQVGPET